MDRSLKKEKMLPFIVNVYLDFPTKYIWERDKKVSSQYTLNLLMETHFPGWMSVDFVRRSN